MRLIILIAFVCGLGLGADRVPDTPWSSIGEALRFLAAYQSDDGHWDVDAYHRRDAAGLAEPGIGGDEADVSVTATVLLVFYGAGHDHLSPGPYDREVARGLAWLLARQRADGSFPGSVSDQCLSAMVLFEAKAVARDNTLAEPARRALTSILAQQVKGPDKHVSGWGDPATGQIDTRATAYALLALSGAMGAGLSIGDTLDGTRTWFLHTWRQANPDAGNAPAIFPATTSLTDGGLAGSAPEAGLACGYLLGAGNGSQVAHGLARACVERWPTIDTPVTDIESLWLATLAIYRVDGACWKRWGAGAKAALIKAQRRTPPSLRGSWDPAGQTFPGHERGRLLCTALGVLVSEVFMAYMIYPHDAPVREAFPEALSPTLAP